MLVYLYINLGIYNNYRTRFITRFRDVRGCVVRLYVGW